jgi:uncharacterized cofD-like protein
MPDRRLKAKPSAPERREGPLRVVAIGGGTGLSSLLHGLKRYASPGDGHPLIEITAIVTVTDDGGSSGRLRREFDVLPPGDIRNCMVALSEDEALLSRLFQYRFASGRGLKGHSFGNLFLTAMTHLTRDFAQAVVLSSEVLRTAGRIYPSTRANVTIEAELTDGRVVRGETKISRSRAPIRELRMRPGRPQPLPETLDALAQADLITFGPGSLFTSIIPNMLVEGIPEAIRKSPALKAYFVNLMWQPYETMNFSASDHVAAIERHAGRRLLDVVVVNTHPISGVLRRRYAAQKVYPVENDLFRMVGEGIDVVGRSLLARAEKVRHDPELTASVVLELAQRARSRHA